MRVLFVGDSDHVTVALTRDLARFQVHAIRADSRASTLGLLRGVDAVVVAFLQPISNTDSTAVCRALRARSEVPIVVLVSRAELGEQILGQRIGVDDYLEKPFRAGTLIARIETVRRIRNRQLEPAGIVQIEDVVIDLRGRSVTVADNVVELSRKEFQILAVLAEGGGGVCTRSELFAQVWDGFGMDDTLNVHVASIRGKLGRRHLIETVRGVGYRLALPEAPLTG